MSEQTPALIRDALPAERDALVTLAFAAYEEYCRLLPQDFWERYRTTIRQSIGEDEAPQRIVAELEGRIGGTVLLYPGDEPGYGITASVVENAARRSPEIRLLAVDPAVRGHGLGQMLMQECIRRTCISGAASIALHTMDVMAAAQQMYLRMGFVRTPATDFTPLAGLLVKGYQLDLQRSALCERG